MKDLQLFELIQNPLK